MPLDPLSPILPGDPGPIPASTWNRLLELLRRDAAQRAGRSGPGPLADTVQGTTVVLVQNSTGSAVSHGYCLAITDALLDPTDSPPAWLSRPALDGDEPTADDDPFVVLLEPIAAGAVGRAAIAGLAIAQVNLTDTGHGYAAPTAGDATKLTSAASGPARILWRESGSTGTQACVLLIGVGGGGLATGVTVKESDGSPSYSSITSLEIDQAQGGVVSQPGSGRAKVSWADATVSQAGVVSTSTQTFAGAKTFQDSVRHEAIVYTSIGSNDVRSTNFRTSFESQRTSSTGSWNMVWTAEAIGGLMAFTGDVGVMTLSTTPSPSDPADSVTVVLDVTAHANFTDDVFFSINGVRGANNSTVGLNFTGGLYMGGSYNGPTLIAGSGGTTGLTVSGGPITSGAGTLTLGGTLVPANGGTGLTTTPADGSILTGTGSGYQQASAVTHSLRWGID